MSRRASGLRSAVSPCFSLGARPCDQSDAAARHLDLKEVVSGDLFLFFGQFRRLQAIPTVDAGGVRPVCNGRSPERTRLLDRCPDRGGSGGL